MFGLSEEHVMLRDAAKSFVAERAPTTRARALRDSGASFDADLWREIAALGWTGIAIPEAYGGSALGFRGLGLVLEECGRTLAPLPLVSTAMAATFALTAGGSEDLKAQVLPMIADGSALVALAVDEHAHHAPHRIDTAAVREGDGWRLDGAKTFVADGHLASHIIVSARTRGARGDRDGITLFLLPTSRAGVTVRPRTTVDGRGAADIALEAVRVEPGALLGAEHQGASLLDDMLDRARIGLACEMLGMAQQAFDITAEYLKTRVQFGQTIGGFQALQHRAAKMLVELEMTRSAVLAALAVLDEDRPNVALYASLAKARAGDTLHLVSNETVQMHGGIGMTDAHDAGLYLKRARVLEALYGSPSFHRDRYATISGY